MKRIKITDRADALVSVEEDEHGHNVLSIGEAEITLSDSLEPEQVTNLVDQIKQVIAGFGFRCRRAALRSVIADTNQYAERLRTDGVAGFVRGDAVKEVVRKISERAARKPPRPAEPNN